jgi:four helix bundle protein
MSRDYRKLRVFGIADALVTDIYRISSAFPPEERFGLQAQIRRAAVSSAVNIVEGSARRTTGEYVNLLSNAAGSAAETRYLLEISTRLRFLADIHTAPLIERYTALCAGLESLMQSYAPENDEGWKNRCKRRNRECAE